MDYGLSLLMGLVVGVIYAMVGVRSPAPPVIALVGLLGMVVGEAGTSFVRQHFATAPAPDVATKPAPSGDPR